MSDTGTQTMGFEIKNIPLHISPWQITDILQAYLDKEIGKFCEPKVKLIEVEFHYDPL